MLADVTSFAYRIVQSNNIIEVLKNNEAASFISLHLDDNVTQLALKHSGTTDFDLAASLQLIKLYQKSKKKLPLFVEHMLALDERSYMQCTSQRVAQYKTTFLRGNTLLDITGGLGVDSIFLASAFDQVTVVEQNDQLHTMAAYNIDVLGLENVLRVNDDGASYLQDTSITHDLIYIDPDRRSDFGRSVALEHLSPNVLDLIPMLRAKARKVYIKLSPLFELKEVWKQFEHVACVYILAERGEIKELGILIDFACTTNSFQVHLKDVYTHFELTSLTNKIPNVSYTKSNYKGLHIPLALVAKAGVIHHFLANEEVGKHPDFEIYFSNNIAIPGTRNFEIVARCSLNAKAIKKCLKLHEVKQCNVVIKGVADKPSTWHQKLGTKDGGNLFLFLLKGAENEALLARFIS